MSGDTPTSGRAEPWSSFGRAGESVPLRRLRFAARVARRDRRLVGDYLALWAKARRVPPAQDAPGDRLEVLTPEEAVELLAARLGPVGRGPRLAEAAAAADAASRAWPGVSADRSLGELAYAVVRARRPAVVVETGVALGRTSAYVLAGLADEARGELHSIDLPPPRLLDEGLVGAAVPSSLRDRWHVHWGSARRLLAPVLGATGAGPRLFVHDSDHAYDHMRWELETAWAALSPGDVLLCDDANFHSAFADVATALAGPAWYVRQTTAGGLTGLLLRV